MLIDRVDKERRLNSKRNLLNCLPPQDNAEFVRPANRGKTTPQPIRIIAGVLAKTEPTREVAAALEISPSVVSRAKNADGPVGEAVSQATRKIRDMALDKLLASLGMVNDASLANCGAKDASIVARNLAGVVDKLSPKDATAPLTQLIIYAPQQRQEKHYETIEVKALP